MLRGWHGSDTHRISHLHHSLGTHRHSNCDARPAIANRAGSNRNSDIAPAHTHRGADADSNPNRDPVAFPNS